ncbi:MAG: alpha/beta hydrolase, partial [Candidatus Eremiobacteraeota bacterium]|nr:alpha/beta hydrolase [Candidatus Eremiobacteraeota bacterium]
MKERLDSHDLLEDVRVPALVIAGAQDVYLEPETLRETAAAIDGAEFVQLDGVGHLPMFEAPAETANALAAFAQRVRV